MKKLSKSWKIFIITTVVLMSSIYGYYKINNRNAFEEMYNSYYNFSLLGSVHRMGQIKPIPKDQEGQDIVKLYYKEQVNGSNIEFSLINFDDERAMFVISSTFIAEGVYLDINYLYDIDTHKLINNVTFRGENVPLTEDKPKQRRELLQKHNISKEYLQKKSDELLDTVLTDWQRYSGSSYSRSNMGRLTIEKDEFLR
ncbi:TipC family immunity protein [Gemella haemolysans]|uniref:Uncharacterized protein n=1 Tax=Gemella haemolysans ATCC 10379 TaxID=546270 RepID=C5NV30_9BACL|nr:TipC family immunity protein [Gemella haemolysans]EER68913.1 hypothetical protein GEMHA0001_1407 [Gemella haemolysans ATCC 10379]KAA8707958.1 TipC family immunity protein [Gemella haemolysans]UBH81933.1 TipC family immunity protein [Gemella haemolysans]VEI38152.1 Uncharacterised protein [Gemella haemolysans]